MDIPKHQFFIREVTIPDLYSAYIGRKQYWFIVSPQGIPLGNPLYSLEDANIICNWINNMSLKEFEEDNKMFCQRVTLHLKNKKNNI